MLVFPICGCGLMIESNICARCGAIRNSPTPTEDDDE